MPSKASASPSKKRKAAEASPTKADASVLPLERLRELATATTATAEEPDARPAEEEPDDGTWRCPKDDCNHRNKANKARCFMCLGESAHIICSLIAICLHKNLMLMSIPHALTLLLTNSITNDQRTHKYQRGVPSLRARSGRRAPNRPPRKRRRPLRGSVTNAATKTME